MGIGLDTADQIASIIGAVVGVLSVILTLRFASAHRSRRPAPAGSKAPGPDPAETAGMVLGMVLVVACFAGCVWGGFRVASNLGEPDPNGGSNAGSSAASGSGPSGRSAAPKDTTAAEEEKAPVVWRGEILLDDTPRDFDHEPPARGNYSIDLNSDAYLQGSTYQKFWGGPVVLWRAKADPDRDDCAVRLETHGVERVSVDRRSRVCLRTNQGRIVLIKFLARDGAGYRTMVTLWGHG
jgi:hypothetical protein